MKKKIVEVPVEMEMELLKFKEQQFAKNLEKICDCDLPNIFKIKHLRLKLKEYQETEFDLSKDIFFDIDEKNNLFDIEYRDKK